ncbi:hypothetical protein C8Q76DRAFT_764874 [Earliella scabrosa]|nr:hypothetical protein C8Q76DRAFT_764874 [Earliella scabrosa]
MRPHGLGVDPTSLVGKKLTRVRRSRTHPCITLQCADGSSFQVLVVGYDPHYRGVPKVLESDSPILNPRSAHGIADLSLTISHAASITLSDKAFQAHAGARGPKEATEDRWTQRHAAFALKFEEEHGWHCVWATMAEYDEKDGERCVFRNYADVYLDRLHTHAHAHHTPAHAQGQRTASPARAHSGSPSSPRKPQGRHTGKRKNHRKNKSGLGPGNMPPNTGGVPKARW